jgi:hypothetical protein
MAQVRARTSLVRRAWLADDRGISPRWIDAETGTRSDVPHHMIYPLKETRPNLHVVTGIHVKHVTFDECVSQFFFSPELCEGTPFFAQ